MFQTNYIYGTDVRKYYEQRWRAEVRIPITVLYLQDILLTCNIWKNLCWGHFYNLVASFRRVEWQELFVILSRFCPLRGWCWGGGLGECIKTCDENVAVAI